MGRLHVRSRSGNYFIMLAFHVDSNVILVKPFHSRHDRHRLAAENPIISRLQNNEHSINLQMLDKNAAPHTTSKLKTNGRQPSNSFPPPTFTASIQPNELSRPSRPIFYLSSPKYPAHSATSYGTNSSRKPISL